MCGGGRAWAPGAGAAGSREQAGALGAGRGRDAGHRRPLPPPVRPEGLPPPGNPLPRRRPRTPRVGRYCLSPGFHHAAGFLRVESHHGVGGAPGRCSLPGQPPPPSYLGLGKGPRGEPGRRDCGPDPGACAPCSRSSPLFAPCPLVRGARAPGSPS